MDQWRMEAEIASQPECWAAAGELAPSIAEALPADGERVAVLGCGTSWFIGQAYGRLREAAGRGWTDAFAASEYPAGRDYDRVVAISRSGHTTEVVDALSALHGQIRCTVLTAVPGSPVADAADDVVALDFADERSVVQTRFATTVLTLLRASLGTATAPLVADCRRALTTELDTTWLAAPQLTFLGHEWTVGLANEAALKVREAARLWAESYPAMDYRHGPISIAEPGRVVWLFGDPPPGLAGDIAATGATLATSTLDPVAHLVVAQRLAVARARAAGLHADQPRHLSRAVVLPPAR